jgi:CDP-glucose 4,6-dehydratase
MVMFNNFFSGKRVFITGHTGFKGSWLSHWLLTQGAEIAGYAMPPDTKPSLFQLLGLAGQLRHIEADIRDPVRLASAVSDFSPDIVLHLAAQSLVVQSYREPRATWETNVLGTVNMLEAVRACEAVRTCLIVTSDKCYENQDWTRGYSETDRLGGHDPYSSSKGACELAVSSWRRSFPNGARIASARSGNVIGGGDWSKYRIVPDLDRAIQSGQPLILRNPQATRPWQHVLEPLHGYLSLTVRLHQPDGADFAEAWNFGPNDNSVVTVEDLANCLISHWGKGTLKLDDNAQKPHEAAFLKLDCSKAAARLDWRGRWDINKTARRTAHWYRDFAAGINAKSLVDADIAAYQST